MNTFPRVVFCIFLSFCLIDICCGQIDVEKLQKHVSYLASDALKGRATGSKGNLKAARYIEKEMKRIGLQPKGEEGYRQYFDAKIAGQYTHDTIRKAQNIIGFLDNQAAKTIVIGAHYDHLGTEGIFSKDSIHRYAIHNGADDNASGVAGLLELARYFVTNNVVESFNLLFIAFGAEEWGLLGSKYFVDNPTIDLKCIHWMLNMDMIGRYNPSTGLLIIGVGTSVAFDSILNQVETPLKYNRGKDGRGGSDQISFYDKNIPVLFFHTNGHEDYHCSTDDADKVDYESLKQILELEIQIIQQSMQYEQLEFIWTN